MTKLILCTLYITNVYIYYTHISNCQYDRFKHLHVYMYIQYTNRTLVLWTSSIVCTMESPCINELFLKIGSIYSADSHFMLASAVVKY